MDPALPALGNAMQQNNRVAITGLNPVPSNTIYSFELVFQCGCRHFHDLFKLFALQDCIID